MSFPSALPSFVPVSLEANRQEQQVIAFAGYLFRPLEPSWLLQNGGERDTYPGHKVADAGGLSGIPERNVFAAGQRVQVRPPCQELSGGKRQSHCLFWLTQGEYDKHPWCSFITGPSTPLLSPAFSVDKHLSPQRFKFNLDWWQNIRRSELEVQRSHQHSVINSTL